jgi:tetratricopeptide (TPR) repeat protein
MMSDWGEQEGIRLWVFGRYGAAEPFLRRAVDLKPEDEMAQYRYGVCLYYLKRFPEAEAHLRRAVDLKPEDENNQHMLGNCLYKSDRFSEALPYLQRAVDLKPHDKKFQEKLKDCQSSIGLIRRSFRGIFERNKPRLEQSDSEAEEQIKLGNSLFNNNQYAEAIPHLKLGVSCHPDVATSHWRLGLSLFRLEQYHDAEEHLRRAVELKPTFTAYRHYLGTCLYHQGKYGEAEAFLQKRVELNPDDETSRHMLGWTLHNLNRYSEAEIHIQHLVALKPNDENLRYMLGACLCRMEKYKEAEAHLQRAVDLKPNDDRGKDSTNRDWLNQCQSNLPHRVTVTDIFEEALARNSGDSIAFGDLGITRQYQNRYAEALALFREALRLCETDFYKIQIVECYEHLGNIELAHQMRLEYPGLFEVITPEPDQDLLTPPTFSEFLSSGATWLDGAGWENRQQSPLLKSLHQQNAKWADPTKVLFPEYDIEEDDLAETLARAESLQHHLHLETEMPVYLQTEWVSVAMTIENGWIRAWVGIELEGCAVSLNPSTWDVQFLDGDRDALFAAAVVVNWYIDCSIMLTAHPKFRRESVDSRDDIRPWQLSDNGWSATSLFSADVDDIREGRQTAPPRAHRVRGHIRSLTQREPTDDARAKAPAHRRAFMKANDTWVQAHTRGGQTETQNLLTRLHKHSSLADFLATAQLDFD